MDSTWYDSFFLEGREGCFVFDTRDEVIRFDDWFVIRIGRQKWRSLKQ